MPPPPASRSSAASKSLVALQHLDQTAATARRPHRRTPPPIRVLVVADGYRFLGLPYGLDFSHEPRGLSRFVSCLLDRGGPARFEVTLAHLDQRQGTAMMDFDARVRTRLPGFAFDDPAQFGPDRYDVAFLFGCVEKLARDDAEGQVRLAADGEPYPLDRLAETEILALRSYQRGGGGLFAAGDIGRAGSFIGQHLPCAGQMRQWDEPPGLNEAPARFDGQAVGNVVPMPQQPRLPAPGSDGQPRDAMPEKAVIVGRIGLHRPPRAGGQTAGPDFPPARDGGPRPLPEQVHAGPPGATGLRAYDGHRAGIGRTLTAVTWRPFLNGALEDHALPGGDGGARCRALALWLSRPGMLDGLS